MKLLRLIPVLLIILVVECFSAAAQEGTVPPITATNADEVRPLALLSEFYVEPDVDQPGLQMGVLAGHRFYGGVPSRVQWSPDGTQLAVYDQRGVWLYDVRDFTHLPRLLEGDLASAPYTAKPLVVYSPDGVRMLVGSFNATDKEAESTPTIERESGSTLTLWDIRRGERQMILNSDLAFIQAAMFSADGRWLAVGGCLEGAWSRFGGPDCRAGAVQIWDATSGQLSAERGGFAGSVNSVALDPAGNYLAAADAGLIQIWAWAELPGGQPVQRWASPVDSQWRDTLAFTADGRQLVVARGSIEIWNTDPFTRARILTGPDDAIGYSQVQIFADNRIAAIGKVSQGLPPIQHMALWDGDQITIQANPPRNAEDGMLDASGTRIAYVSSSSVVVVDITTQQPSTVLTPPIQASEIAFSPDSELVAIGGGASQGNAKLWIRNARTGNPIQRRAYDPDSLLGGLSSLRFTSNGDLLGTMALGPDIIAWNPVTLEETAAWQIPQGIILDWCETHGTIVGLANEGPIYTWELLAGSRIVEVDPHPTVFRVSVACSPTSDLVVVGTDCGVYSLGSSDDPLVVTGWIFELAFSPDGALLAAADEETVYVLDVARSSVVLTVPGNTGLSPGLAFSPDSTQLAVGMADGTVEVWDIYDGQQLGRLEGHQGKALHVTFNPEGDVLATGGQDGVVRLWHAETGQLLNALGGHVDQIAGIRFSPDGTRLATLTDNGQVILWGMTPVP